MNRVNITLTQVTTHSKLLSQDELRQAEIGIGIKVASFFLQEFDTEVDFLNKIRYVKKITVSPQSSLHIIYLIELCSACTLDYSCN